MSDDRIKEAYKNIDATGKVAGERTSSRTFLVQVAAALVQANIIEPSVRTSLFTLSSDQMDKQLKEILEQARKDSPAPAPAPPPDPAPPPTPPVAPVQEILTEAVHAVGEEVVTSPAPAPEGEPVRRRGRKPSAPAAAGEGSANEAPSAEKLSEIAHTTTKLVSSVVDLKTEMAVSKQFLEELSRKMSSTGQVVETTFEKVDFLDKTQSERLQELEKKVDQTHRLLVALVKNVVGFSDDDLRELLTS